MTRAEYFCSKVDYVQMVAHHKFTKYDEFRVNRHGYITVYRVYGNSIENYLIKEV